VPGVNTGTLVASLIMAAVLALVAFLAIRGMLRGWLRRAQRQAALIGQLPPLPGSTSAARWCRAGWTASRWAISAIAQRPC
jgi:hypothetical protein